ncbi:MAG: hypothetical protein JO359_00085 [Candidatus Eremiobacteraeota bacterium]|nr:hypothetical protein [Candidatus Eremiobacteraeota bacterium]
MNATSTIEGPGLSLVPGAIAVNPDLRSSWTSPAAKNASAILFVGDFSAGDVDMFAVPSLRLVGTKTGFSYPNGMCSDREGNVWLVTTGNGPTGTGFQLYEFSHTGAQLDTFPDTSGYPASCAIDQMTGNLAVANFYDVHGANGFVQIYQHAKGSPKSYSGGNIVEFYLVGYDSNGNLFADGCSVKLCTNGGKFQLAELPKGGSSFEPITLQGGTIYFPGNIVWDSAHNDLIVGDLECGGIVYNSCLYRVTVSGSTGTITASTPLLNAIGGHACFVAQPVLTRSGNLLAGGDYEPAASQCPSYTASGAYLWNEQTGEPVDDIAAGLVAPTGAAISYATN